MTDLDELFRPLIEDSRRFREPVATIETRAHERRVRRAVGNARTFASAPDSSRSR